MHPHTTLGEPELTHAGRIQEGAGLRRAGPPATLGPRGNSGLLRVRARIYEDLVQNLENHPLVLRLAEANHRRDSSGGIGRLEQQVVSAYILIQTEVGQA